MNHRAALYASVALTIVTAALIATQWGTLISRGSPSDPTAITEQVNSPAPTPTDVAGNAIANAGISMGVKAPSNELATETAPAVSDFSARYEENDDESDDQVLDDDDGYEHEDDDGEHETDDD